MSASPLLAASLDAEPPSEAVVACEINVGTPSKPEWVQRTYHARRRWGTGDWSVAMGDGLAFEVFPTWDRVRSWLDRLQPRAVEVVFQ